MPNHFALYDSMEWKSINEHEPPEAQTVLVTGPEFDEISCASLLDEKWRIMANGCDSLHYPTTFGSSEVICPEITHWMTLPHPPES